MFEIRITEEAGGEYAVRAILNPYGGLAVPKDAEVGRLRAVAAASAEGSAFQARLADGAEVTLKTAPAPGNLVAAAAELLETADLSGLELAANHDLWPQCGHRITVVNTNRGPKNDVVGTYRVCLDGEEVGLLAEHQKREGHFSLLRKALKLAAEHLRRKPED